MSDTWTIGELAEQAAGALRAHGQPLNGRVRDVPGERLIRWYTTIGLVDPPLTRRGRTARYGRRHLLQLVAVKRLQASGLSIADIQLALAGATDAMLERAAQPGFTGAAADGAARAAPGEPQDRRPRFWAEGAGRSDGEGAAHPDGIRREPADPDGIRPRTAPPPAPRPAAAPRAAAHHPGTPVRGMRLADGVTLVLDGPGRNPSRDDIQAVLTAAAPLLAVLDERKLA